jgi:cobalt-precorrin-5B (C1)-methyltransferase
MASEKPTGELRRGWTTGACATAALKAAYTALLSGAFPDPVEIRLPGGQRPSFALNRAELADGTATAGVIKDAGDDPDVTHGAEIVITVAPGAAGSGITFAAGEGVGTVTKPGLPVAVGEPAINPVPRRMMSDAAVETAHAFAAAPDVAVTVAIPGGAALAAETTNPRLGIVGGLSVLGTTGVVIPYSCASWIHSIHSGIDVARATGIDHLAASTGRTSEAAVRKLLGLPEEACIAMGDFAGGLLKYLRRRPVARLTLAGGFAKISKLAAGNMDLHSHRSTVEIGGLAQMLADLGADGATVAAAKGANTAGQVHEIAATAGLAGGKMALGDLVARRAREVALATLSGETAVEVVIFDRAGEVIGRAGRGRAGTGDGGA